MKYPVLDIEPSVSAWNDRAAGKELDHGKLSLLFMGDGQDRLTDLEIDDFRVELDKEIKPIVEEFPESLPRSRGGKFDATLVPLVHSFFSAILPVEALSDLGFWRWLSIVSAKGYFWEFLKWRFPNKAQVNWGIAQPSDAREVYFYRAWLRGHVMYDQSLEDPYAYAIKGGGDMWRSQILRQEFGRDPEFVKAFLDFVETKELSTEQLRKQLIPSLRAWTTFGTFSHLDYADCYALIERLYGEEL